MRKTLAQAILAAFCAILTPLLEGGGVMIPLGLHMGIGSERDWENPYITDGLVAMWDGIEHKNSSTYWRDLIGDRDMVLDAQSGTPFSWASDAIVLGETTGMMCDFLSENPLPKTVEIVGDWRLPVSFEVNFISLWSNKYYGYDPYEREFGIRYAASMVYVSPKYNFDAQFGTGVTVSTKGSLSWISSTSSIRGVSLYKNGSRAYYINGSTDINDSFRYVRIGDTFAPYWGGRDCKINSIRFYSKRLTADEIAHNYAIDKARFGLTG